MDRSQPRLAATLRPAGPPGARATGTALALATSARLRFVPAADYNGTPPALVVRGLDDTYAGAFSTTTGGTWSPPSCIPHRTAGCRSTSLSPFRSRVFAATGVEMLAPLAQSPLGPR